jgi:hypothetical protein
VEVGESVSIIFVDVVPLHYDACASGFEHGLQTRQASAVKFGVSQQPQRIPIVGGIEGEKNKEPLFVGYH